ncbi:GNAT family N-acetyltransferase [Azospirillum brasilense]|uniref:GNAT family N-acetyltransferase n=1 Tax=Azospirillum brasilense TaxID=192 RepID=UPI000E69C051|nr:GNAT family N-acetyltransferase [Azospirillum brasilense]NUB27730.1 GNAT family N-acetyltransferase [Azospirillum brasilense]NUB35279.1 GNAT family N-acetyltransferase [Azospirillum brasilense]RIV97407.1 GNAT family N-acetyltransferase [Azospirillum brasilense]
MPPFIVFGMPRSRTAWLSRFLTYGDWVCGHEELRHARSLDDVRSWLAQPCTGTAETAAAPWWRLARHLRSDLRVVVVRRDVTDATDSLMWLGLFADRTAVERLMLRLDRKLEQISRRVPDALSVRFEDLEREEVCAAVFEHCLPYQHDPDWWKLWAPVNIQCDMRAIVRHAHAHSAQLDKLERVAKHQTLALMARGEPGDLDGLTFQAEPFDTWLRDAEKLFNDHLVAVGEAPGDWQGKNIPLLRALDHLGAMQIMTARCNGRMFGYLMSVISPSLESPDVLSAQHATFYADPAVRGLGLRLQRAALEALRQRGVDEVFARAGTRGEGPRMAPLYRRLGGEDFGQLFRIDLTGV